MAVNMPNGHKIYQHFPHPDPPKLIQIGIFGLKTNQLASLARSLLCVCFFSKPSFMFFYFPGRNFFDDSIFCPTIFFAAVVVATKKAPLAEGFDFLGVERQSDQMSL
jgi:hypothetical protein